MDGNNIFSLRDKILPRLAKINYSVNILSNPNSNTNFSIECTSNEFDSLKPTLEVCYKNNKTFINLFACKILKFNTSIEIKNLDICFLLKDEYLNRLIEYISYLEILQELIELKEERIKNFINLKKEKYNEIIQSKN